MTTFEVPRYPAFYILAISRFMKVKCLIGEIARDYASNH